MLSELSDPNAVLSAIAEYDRTGQAAFLAKYGYAPARRYKLSYNGNGYDSKAIVGAAFGYQFPARGALKADQFTGGVTVGSDEGVVNEKNGIRHIRHDDGFADAPERVRKHFDLLPVAGESQTPRPDFSFELRDGTAASNDHSSVKRCSENPGHSHQKDD